MKEKVRRLVRPAHQPAEENASTFSFFIFSPFHFIGPSSGFILKTTLLSYIVTFLVLLQLFSK